MSTRRRLAAAALLALAATGARPEDTPFADGDAMNGQALFLAHCAQCHGAEARGNGPEAASLNPPPKDLTLLAAENGGTFPTMRAVMRIDGRDPLVAHGSPMPVYGPYFEGDEALMRAETGQPVLTSVPVRDLVVWLEGLQRQSAE